MGKGIEGVDLFGVGVAIDEVMGIRLEMVAGIPVWEAHPALRHQMTVDRIRGSIRPLPGDGSGCGCVSVSDLYVQFPDGSLKRPDISIFCRVPEEMETAVTLVPEAVIEILSPGYEKKDTEIGVPFYLSQGVRDIVLFDPRSGEVTHYGPSGKIPYTAPVELTFACGCQCVV